MSAVAQVLSGSTVKAGVSAAALLLIDKYNYPSGNILSTQGAMRGGVQFLSSLWQNIVVSWIRPILPSALQLSSMFLNPIIVGLEFALLEMIIDGQGSGMYFKFNFITSMLAEAASALISPSVSAFAGTPSLGPTTAASIASAY